ncbi:MAG: hypothetical protein ACYCYD_00970 [Acidimicrobiales bacterium]
MYIGLLRGTAAMSSSILALRRSRPVLFPPRSEFIVASRGRGKPFAWAL